MTVERHTDLVRQGTFVKVLVDGVEVTHRCVLADDKVGRVVLLCRDPKHLDWKAVGINTHLRPDTHAGVCKFDLSSVDVDMLP
jgi:hypothetical protein